MGADPDAAKEAEASEMTAPEARLSWREELVRLKSCAERT